MTTPLRHFPQRSPGRARQSGARGPRLEAEEQNEPIQGQKAKAFEAALNHHGFALQYAVAQSARDLARFEWSNWFPFVPELPVSDD